MKLLNRRGCLLLVAVALLPWLLPSLLPVPAMAQGRIKVVATFSILGDLAAQVGGDRIEVVTLVGPDGDAHVYSPTPLDARRVADAEVMVTNGLNFDGWIDRLVTASGTRARVIVAAAGVKAAAEKPGENGMSRGGTHDGPHGGIDPHAWQSVANAKIYVSNIRGALVAADPDGRAAYEANAAGYLHELDALDEEVRTAIERIPPERRKIITSHDAFGYFELAYGLDFIAPQGVSTEAEASAKDVARIIQQIKREKIKAVFFENISDPRLMQRIAKETGAKIGDRLYSDALSPPGGPAATYIDMMRHNIKAFSAALSG
jgi:zinc/manganese transport system substrate-binding protein